VASVLQLADDFIFPNINCDDVNPEIESIIDIDRIPTKLITKDLNYLAKANFGFGDVNACIIFKKFKS
jgi:3-oxoacyl-[acyl-carrier-protein] synthase-1